MVVHRIRGLAFFSTFKSRSLLESNASLLETLSQLIRKPESIHNKERVSDRSSVQSAINFNVVGSGSHNVGKNDTKSESLKPGDVSCFVACK